MRTERKVSRADLRRLNAELGLSPARGAGLGIALALIFGAAVVATPFVLDIGPSEVAYGKVMTVRQIHGRTASSTTALVLVGGRRIAVSISRAPLCKVGDRIELIRHRVLVGERYTAGYRECARV